MAGKARAERTELIARFALRGPFFLIAGGEWLPDQDSMRRSVRRYTTTVEETLDRLVLARPSTCLQLRDQLAGACSQQNSPVLILDFLHHFHDPDVDLSLRRRVLEACCRSLEDLSRSGPVFVLVECLPGAEYEGFFSRLASVAGEVLHVREASRGTAAQPPLF